MTYLPQLKDQLVTSSPQRPRRRGRAVAAIVVIGLLLAAGALAATGVIEIGSKIEPPKRFQGDPEVGPGVTVDRSARLLRLRVADPAGGPPWGMRLVRTSRDLTCLQVGRVVDGKLGVLGQDGIAHDDGRFHELSPRFARLQPGCAAPDARGNAFIAVNASGLASGDGPRRSCLGPGEEAPNRPHCPVADHRRFVYGLAGPEVSKLAYRDGRGHIRSVSVAPPEGAYLIVRAERQLGGGAVVGTEPTIGHPITRITYRDGRFCPPPHATGEERRCGTRGYQSLLAGVDPEEARRQLRIESSPRRVTIGFDAPVAVDDARLSYWASAHFERTCPQIWFVPSTNRDVRRGAPVELEMKIPRRCHGTLRGEVRLAVNETGMPTAPAGGARGQGVLIGRFAADVP